MRFLVSLERSSITHHQIQSWIKQLQRWQVLTVDLPPIDWIWNSSIMESGIRKKVPKLALFVHQWAPIRAELGFFFSKAGWGNTTIYNPRLLPTPCVKRVLTAIKFLHKNHIRTIRLTILITVRTYFLTAAFPWNFTIDWSATTNTSITGARIKERVRRTRFLIEVGNSCRFPVEICILDRILTFLKFH